MFTFKGEEEEGEIAFRKKLCFIDRLFKLFDVAVLSLSSLLRMSTQLYLTV